MKLHKNQGKLMGSFRYVIIYLIIAFLVGSVHFDFIFSLQFHSLISSLCLYLAIRMIYMENKVLTYGYVFSIISMVIAMIELCSLIIPYTIPQIYIYFGLMIHMIQVILICFGMNQLIDKRLFIYVAICYVSMNVVALFENLAPINIIIYLLLLLILISLLLECYAYFKNKEIKKTTFHYPAIFCWVSYLLLNLTVVFIVNLIYPHFAYQTHSLQSKNYTQTLLDKGSNQFFDVKVYDYNKSQYLTAYHIKLNNVKSKQLKVTVQRSSSAHLSYSPCQIVDFKVSDQQKDYSYKENIDSYSYISDVIGYKEYQLFLNPHIQHYDIYFAFIMDKKNGGEQIGLIEDYINVYLNDYDFIPSINHDSYDQRMPISVLFDNGMIDTMRNE